MMKIYFSYRMKLLLLSCIAFLCTASLTMGLTKKKYKMRRAIDETDESKVLFKRGDHMFEK